MYGTYNIMLPNVTGRYQCYSCYIPCYPMLPDVTNVPHVTTHIAANVTTCFICGLYTHRPVYVCYIPD